jgi:L-cysteine:1D-myo-inositol 2-amino-2-deoxy-alpha-D-glucopyranoside ligase
VFVSKLRASGIDPSAIRLALFAGHYRTDRPWSTDLLTAAQEQLAGWRDAVAQDAGPDGAELVARLRTHLADDLDTPGALAAVDAWAAAARAHGGDDAAAPRVVRDAVNALLGVVL